MDKVLMSIAVADMPMQVSNEDESAGNAGRAEHACLVVAMFRMI